MENNELIEIESENGIVSVNTNDIPDIISGRYRRYFSV